MGQPIEASSYKPALAPAQPLALIQAPTRAPTTRAPPLTQAQPPQAPLMQLPDQ